MKCSVEQEKGKRSTLHNLGIDVRDLHSTPPYSSRSTPILPCPPSPSLPSCFLVFPSFSGCFLALMSACWRVDRAGVQMLIGINSEETVHYWWLIPASSKGTGRWPHQASVHAPMLSPADPLMSRRLVEKARVGLVDCPVQQQICRLPVPNMRECMGYFLHHILWNWFRKKHYNTSAFWIENKY